MEFENLKYLVVGTGFFGSVIAERIAADKNERVVVIDRRGHVGGNCFSEIDSDTGIECHKYGSHIFHTRDENVWKYINRFCSFNSYRHKVLTNCGGEVYQMPINLQTINSFYKRNMSPHEAENFMKSEIAKEKIKSPGNLEDKALSLIGRPLYESLIRGYTQKQWETDPRELPPEIISRLPVRYNYKTDYFNDPWQGIPTEGYCSIFKNLLDHPNIDVYCKIDFFSIRHKIPKNCCVIYTGPIDRLFDYKFGKLGWRTLVFEKKVMNMGDFQGTSVMNYADENIPYTRIHEFRHFHEERNYADDRTVIFLEYSKSVGSNEGPYYPVNTAKDRIIFDKYYEQCKSVKNLIVGGRLGAYKYLNMDQTIADALGTYYQKIKNT